MNPPPNALASAGLAVDQRPAPVAGVAEAGRSLGRLHAVPVRDVVSSSHWLAEAVYRGFEILAALIGLVAGLPLLLILAAMIRCDSPGSVFFLHQRPGRSRIMRGRELKGRADLHPPPGGFDPDRLYYVPSYFTLVKFRTMYSDARTRFPDFYAYKYTPDEFHRQYPTIRHDPRVTRVGRVLRKLSVDELPNLWSVLAGNLRLVGPRPEAPEVLRYYTPEEMYKFAYKPGITGLAQINGRGFLNWGETIGFDLQYLRTRSVGLDLKIILMTLMRVSTRHGAF
jgi:lipopolysaccharide/colanic/teichoic acid biosynthesis glycosyltransferase